MLENHSNFSWNNNQTAQGIPQQNALLDFQELKKKPTWEEAFNKLAASSTEAMTRIAKASSKFMQQTEKSFRVQEVL